MAEEISPLEDHGWWMERLRKDAKANRLKALLQRLERLGQDSVGNYGMPICAEAAAELRRLYAENERLHQINQSHEMKLSVRGYEIQIADLKAVNQELLEAMISFTNSAYIKKHHPKRYAAAMAAIAKAEGKL